jgi:hypothetical protein
MLTAASESRSPDDTDSQRTLATIKILAWELAQWRYPEAV